MTRLRTVATLVLFGGLGGLTALTLLNSWMPMAQAAEPPAAVVASIHTVVDGRNRILQIDRRPDLQFRSLVGINGQSVDMLIDTGANVTVLTMQDAHRIGAHALKDGSHVQVMGLTRDKVRFRSIGNHSLTLGPIVLEDVPVVIDETGELTSSILGQNAFCNLARMTIEKNRLEIVHDAPAASACHLTA